jgi:hypothetical protein
MILFWVWSSSAVLVTEMPGNVVGMYIRVPSFRLGMNSVPSCRAGQTLTASTASASRIVSVRALSTHRITGR